MTVSFGIDRAQALIAWSEQALQALQASHGAA
jgi:hypothetical protein